MTIDPQEESTILQEVHATRQAIEALRAEIATRPSRREVTIARRAAIAFCVLFIIFAVQVNDVATHFCSPGARAWSSITHEPPIQSIQEARDVANDDSPIAFCDAFFPWSEHSSRDAWPTAWNLIGIGIQLAGVTALGLWVQRAYRTDEAGRPTRHDSKER